MQKLILQIEFTAHIQIVLFSLILVNVYLLGLVHLASQTILVLNVQLVRGLSAWTVRFLGILL